MIRNQPFRAGFMGLLALLLAYLCGVLLINSNLKPQAAAEHPTPLSDLPDAVPATLTVSSWNLGYAGLGAASSFIADGGKAFLPPSRGAVDANLAGILETVASLPAGLLLFQEVSNASPLSFWIPVLDRLKAALAGSQLFYRPDAATRFIPFPLALDHGTLLSSRYNPASIEIVPLPSEPGAMLGFLKRVYAIHVARFPIEGGGELVLGNLHLSAFDDGGHTRRAQIEATMAFAAGEYAKGHHVILGGDWNMVLSDPGWPHSTDEKYLFWIHPFPRDLLPAGWTIATDPRVPTVRTLHKPYVAGENYVTSIDGFIVSPNITVRSVTTRDIGFAVSDHQPVTATFTLD